MTKSKHPINSGIRSVHMNEEKKREQGDGVLGDHNSRANGKKITNVGHPTFTGGWPNETNVLRKEGKRDRFQRRDAHGPDRGQA